jgi:cell division protein FtsN
VQIPAIPKVTVIPIRLKEEDTVKAVVIKSEPKPAKVIQVIVEPEPENKTPVIDTLGWTVQAGAFHYQTNAINARYRLQFMLNFPVSTIFEDGYYKVRIMGLSDEDTARKLIDTLAEKGFPGSFIIKK